MDFDGTHLLADLFDCAGLDDIDRIDRALRLAVEASGATLLDMKLHSFGVDAGVTGVALLAESHISIHTWPERGYAAVDIFLCGRKHDLGAALAALAGHLSAQRIAEHRVPRGYASEPAATGSS
jgi:S-adenosylmethionine decarboxylase